MNLTEQLKKINKDNISQSYIIFGDFEKNKIDIKNFLIKELGFQFNNNSDFFDFKGISLPIEKTREIKSINSKTKNNSKWRIFFLEFNSISIESQNSLLKTLEESSENTIFFLFLPTNSFVLDTVKSRSQIMIGSEYINSKPGVDFIESSYLDRLNLIKKLEKEEYFLFLNSLDIALVEKKEEIIKFSETYSIFIELKSQSQNKGSGVFYVLEFLSFFIKKK